MDQHQKFDKISAVFQDIQNTLCEALVAVTNENYREDCWDYKKGKGGGKTRAFLGKIIEKGGINFSSITGKLDKKITQKFNLPFTDSETFQACGVSLILHPYNPFVPAVHFNIRYFQGQKQYWFGGGVDLNPYYPLPEDIIAFHTNLKKTCDIFDKDYYLKFKKKCDEYFYLPHRQETRGVGGIFFDSLTSKKDFAFSQALGKFFIETYIPILQKRMHSPFRHYNKEYQAHRRARYTEFNLLYDKGTAFGLQTGGSIESIFLSLPPIAKWLYDFQVAENTEEQEAQKYFQIQDWLAKP